MTVLSLTKRGAGCSHCTRTHGTRAPPQLPVCRYRSPLVLMTQAVSSLSATNTAWGRASYQCRFPLMVTFPQAKARLDFCSIFQRRAPVEIKILFTIQKILRITYTEDFIRGAGTEISKTRHPLLPAHLGKETEAPRCEGSCVAPAVTSLNVSKPHFLICNRGLTPALEAVRKTGGARPRTQGQAAHGCPSQNMSRVTR